MYCGKIICLEQIGRFRKTIIFIVIRGSNLKSTHYWFKNPPLQANKLSTNRQKGEIQVQFRSIYLITRTEHILLVSYNVELATFHVVAG